jgi:hypothetical protein
MCYGLLGSGRRKPEVLGEGKWLVSRETVRMSKARPQQHQLRKIHHQLSDQYCRGIPSRVATKRYTDSTTRMIAKLWKPDKFRFAVGTEDGPRSQLWFIKIEKTGDVYAGALFMNVELKLSLHRDRICQFGMAGKSGSSHIADRHNERDHYFFRWNRPRTPSDKVQHVASIISPTALLNQSPLPVPSQGKPRIMFEPAPAGQALEFGIFYSTMSHEELGPVRF